HHMLDGAIFAGSIHGLKNQEHGPTVLGVEHVLELGHFGDSLPEQLLSVLLGMNVAGRCRIEILEAKIFTVVNAVWIGKLAGPAHGDSSAKTGSVTETN